MAYDASKYAPRGPWGLDSSNVRHEVINGDGYHQVEQRTHGRLIYNVRYFINDTYGADMNVNGQSDSDVFENVYDGGDNVYWTKTVVVGVAGDFPDSTEHVYDGTYSLSTVPSGNGDTVQFSRPTTVNTSTYATLELWLYIHQWSIGASDIIVRLWNTSTDMQVGNSVIISDFANVEDTQEWQRVNFLMSDFVDNGDPFNAVRMEIVGIDNKADVFMDLIRFREYGATNPVTFTLDRREGETLLVDGYQFTFANPNYDTSNPVPYLDHTKMLGIPLPNGVFYRRYSYGVPRFTYTWRNVQDILSLPHFEIRNFFCHPDSGAFLSFRYKFPEPFVLDDEAEDYVRIFIHDDCSVFSHVRYAADTRIVIPDKGGGQVPT